MCRKPNPLEYLLIIVSIIISGLGYYYVRLSITSYGPFSFEANSLVLLLLSIIILLLLTAVHENSREILKGLSSQQNEELRMLREELRKRK